MSMPDPRPDEVFDVEAPKLTHSPQLMEAVDRTLLARNGYDAYGATTEYKNWQGLPMPTWAELPEKQTAAWLSAARAIRARVMNAVWRFMTTDAINEHIRTRHLRPEIPFEPGQISDGYHTIDELYDHRIELFVQLAKLHSVTGDARSEPVWRSKKHSDGELAYGGKWFVLGINTSPGKQVTYHLPIERWDEASFADELERAPEWDGHTSADVLQRLKNL